MSSPSAVHQQLVLWIARKMVADGFMVNAVDGRLSDGQVWSLPRVPALDGVRADVLGESADGAIAFGEAKTPADVVSSHTYIQFACFGRAVRGLTPCWLYVAVPRSAASHLDRALAYVGLLGLRHVVRLHVPDVLLEDGDGR